MKMLRIQLLLPTRFVFRLVSPWTDSATFMSRTRVNSRVLEYDNPLALTPGTPGQAGSAGDVTADLSFESGANFVRGDCSDLTQVCSPGQLAIDSQNNLYVTDESRVLEFLDPTAPGGGMPGAHGYAGDTTSDAVYGQLGNFSSNFCNGDGDSTNVNATSVATARLYYLCN